MIFTFLNVLSLSSQIECRRFVHRGDPLLIILRHSVGQQNMAVSLLRADSVSMSTAGVFPVKDAGEGSIYAAIVGIPSTLKGGTYVVTAISDGVRLYEKSIEVLERKFPIEKLEFDDKLSELMTKPDPQKAQESRELSAMLQEFHPESVFHNTAFRLPVTEDHRTSYFGDRREYHLTNGSKMVSVHQGVDFGLKQGTPVYAAAAGKVVMSRVRIMTGNTIVIQHLPGVYSLYFHLDSRLVEENEYVKTSQFIGAVGQTGLSTGSHLHWEIRTGGIAVDPESFMRTDILDMSLLEDVSLAFIENRSKGGDVP